MSLEQDKEITVFDLNLSSVSSTDREKILNYFELSKKVVGAAGSYFANIRSLMLMMAVTLTLTLQKIDNRTIVLAIISMQFLKTLFSRLFEASVILSLKNQKKNLTNLLLQKIKDYKND